MASFSVVITASDVERVAASLLKVDQTSINNAALQTVNEVAVRGYAEARRRILSGVNLTDAYLQSRMIIEPANDPSNPQASIVALRTGGRQPALRPVTLRQYAPVQRTVATKWNNNDPRIAANKMGANPRKPGTLLRWKRRIGAESLGIPVGQKQAGISVEVIKGSRKDIRSAFYAPARSGNITGGNGLLIFVRRPGTAGKGKLKALYSLSVWQMFRKQSAVVIPFIQKDLEQTLGDEVVASIDKALGL